MVLTATWPIVCAFVLGGCMGQRAPEKAGEPTPIHVMISLEGADGRAHEAPEQFVKRLSEGLAVRGLVAVFVPASGAVGASSESRLRVLGERAPEWSAALLVEARAAFFSQLAGRWRWDVDASTTVALRAGAERRVTTTSVAAFLAYEHEREPEALAFVARQLLDDILATVDQISPQRR